MVPAFSQAMKLYRLSLWQWLRVHHKPVADLRFDKGSFKSKIRMRAHFLPGEPRPLFVGSQ